MTTQPLSVPLSEELRTFLAAQGFAPDDVHARNRDNATALMLAARLAPPALVRELLGAGADIHARTPTAIRRSGSLAQAAMTRISAC